MNHDPNSTGPEHCELNDHLIAAALQYSRLGYRPIPLVGGSKQAALKWKPFQSRPPTEREIVEWFSAGEPNIALVTGNGLVVVDVDAADREFLDEIIAHTGDTPMKSRTPSGGTHLFFRMRSAVHYGNAVKIKEKPMDMRCEGAYAVVPWSRNAHGIPYRWEGPVLPVDELPLLKVSWLRERKPRRVITPVEVGANLDSMVRRARAYIARIEGAIAGQRGHDRTFRVCCVLTHKFRLSFEQAWPVLKEWNLQCEPHWSDRELEHKLLDSLKQRG